jgi:hypothetical protein
MKSRGGRTGRRGCNRHPRTRFSETRRVATRLLQNAAVLDLLVHTTHSINFEMVRKSGEPRYYAIHFPPKYQGVHYKLWENVQPMTMSPGAIHRAFDDRLSANYFVKHGHLKGVTKLFCVECQQQEKNPTNFPPRDRRAAPVVRFHERQRRQESKGEENSGDKLQETDYEQFCPGQYYAVIKGRKPGIYDDWDEARKQVEGFPKNEYVGCSSRKAAIDYLRHHGIPHDQIRLFRKTFKQEPGFTPNPTASFGVEFKRFANSQRWSEQEKRQARVDAIRDEIIQRFLPDGIRISEEQDDDEGYVDLDDDQTLEVFQAMCRAVDKPAHPSIDECLVELKQKPYVNIMDFVDCYRGVRSTKIPTFKDWVKFKKYTMTTPGRRMDMRIAQENEFLAPFLQDFSRNEDQQRDPRRTRAMLVARGVEKRRRQAAERQSLAAPFRPDLPRDLSPSVFDRSLPLPRSPTPASEPATPRVKVECDNGNNSRIKYEPSAATSSSSPNLAVAPSTPPTVHSDADCSNSEYGSDLDEAMLDEFSDSEYGINQFDDVMLEDMKSQSMESSHFVSRPTHPHPTNLSTPSPIKQEIKLEAGEPAPSPAPVTPPVTPTPHTTIPLIDLTQDEEPVTSSTAHVGRPTNRVSLGKRPRASSPLVVVAAKRTRSGAQYEYTPYMDLPKKQTNILSFFTSSQARA